MAEQEAPKTVKIEDKTYSVESLTEKGIQLINNISMVDQIVARHRSEMEVASFAKDKLVAELVAETPNFQEVVVEEVVTPVEAPAEGAA